MTSSSRNTAFACIALCASVAVRTVVAHEPAGPQGSPIVNWSAPNVARVTASMYGDAFGMEAKVRQGLPAVENVDGRSCVVASYLLFDVADDFAFDIDEVVEVVLTIDRRRSTGFFIGYDRNARAESLREIEFDDGGGFVERRVSARAQQGPRVQRFRDGIRDR